MTMARETIVERLYPPWTDASGLERFSVVLGLVGLGLALFGDVVFWFERGYSYWDYGSSPGVSDPSQSWASVRPISYLIVGLAALQVARRDSWLGYIPVASFALLGAGAAWFASGDPHPVSAIPAVVLLAAAGAGVVVHVRRRL